MLEQKDLDMLKNMIETVMKTTEESILMKVDEKLLKSETLVLGEIERTRSYLEKQIEKVQKNMDELNQYYRITKLEADNTALWLRLIDGLSKRVEELEKKTA